MAERSWWWGMGGVRGGGEGFAVVDVWLWWKQVYGGGVDGEASDI